jgi:hypothetical protein
MATVSFWSFPWYEANGLPGGAPLSISFSWSKPPLPVLNTLMVTVVPAQDGKIVMEDFTAYPSGGQYFFLCTIRNGFGDTLYSWNVNLTMIGA